MHEIRTFDEDAAEVASGRGEPEAAHLVPDGLQGMRVMHGRPSLGPEDVLYYDDGPSVWEALPPV